jgi:hypothetical protein
MTETTGSSDVGRCRRGQCSRAALGSMVVVHVGGHVAMALTLARPEGSGRRQGFASSISNCAMRTAQSDGIPRRPAEGQTRHAQVPTAS